MPRETAPSARAYAIVARDARKAVVFRRGPAKQVRMLLWDLTTDEIEGGQWLAGRIYEERCDVSPNGELVVYFAGKFGSEVPTFTAVSRPPWFTALAFWPDTSTWGGGGAFASDDCVALLYGRVDFEKNGGRTMPERFEVITYTELRARVGDAADRCHGFTVVSPGTNTAPTATMGVVYDPPRISEKPGRSDLVLQRLWHGGYERNGTRSVYSYRLVAAGGRRDRATVTVDLGRLDWADWDHDGSLLYSDTGARLLRRDVSQAFEKPLGELPPPKLVRDLSGMTFTSVAPPPDAKRWPRRYG